MLFWDMGRHIPMEGLLRSCCLPFRFAAANLRCSDVIVVCNLLNPCSQAACLMLIYWDGSGGSASWVVCSSACWIGIREVVKSSHTSDMHLAAPEPSSLMHLCPFVHLCACKHKRKRKHKHEHEQKKIHPCQWIEITAGWSFRTNIFFC